MIRLRGHHLLCLLGYRGMGYSKEYVTNMTEVHETLRSAPDTEVLLVFGPDDLCAKFPKTETCHCQDENIHVRDASILAKLGLKVGQQVPWWSILQRVAYHVQPSDINHLCSTCSWRLYGVCEEGVQRIRDGQGMPMVHVRQES